MCYYPTLIKNPKYIPNKKNNGIVPECYDKRVMAVPIGCGYCIECRKQKAREWQVRLLEDVKKHTNGIFITLTFSDESIKQLAEEITQRTTKIKIGEKKYVDKNGKLRKRYKYRKVTEHVELRGYETDNAIATLAVRKFTERWRRKFKKAPRHWLITELGHKGTENVHMHGFIWTNENPEEIRKIWQYGYVWNGDKKGNRKINYVNEKTVNYCMKYVSKMDFDHKEYKSKILTSAGIGRYYFQRTDWIQNQYKGEETKEYYKARTGHKMALPMYYRNKIYTDDQKEALWLQKLNNEKRYVGGEAVSIKDGLTEYYALLEHHRRKNLRLGYGTSTRDWNAKKYEEERRILLQQERIKRVEEKKEPTWLTETSWYGNHTKAWERELENW